MLTAHITLNQLSTRSVTHQNTWQILQLTLNTASQATLSHLHNDML